MLEKWVKFKKGVNWTFKTFNQSFKKNIFKFSLNQGYKMYYQFLYVPNKQVIWPNIEIREFKKIYTKKELYWFTSNYDYVQ